MQFTQKSVSSQKFKTLIFYGKETNFKLTNETHQIVKTFDSNLYSLETRKEKTFSNVSVERFPTLLCGDALAMKKLFIILAIFKRSRRTYSRSALDVREEVDLKAAKKKFKPKRKLK